MTNGLFSLFGSLIANTPPYRKGLSSRKFLSLFLILFLAVGNAWGQEVVLFNTNFTNWETSPKENTGLSDGNTYTLTDGTNAVATLVGQGCKLNDTKNLPTSTGIEGYNTNKFRFGSEENYVYITPNKEFNNGGKIRILVSAEKTKTTDILGTVVVGDESLGNLHGWTAKAMCDWQEFEVPETISGIAQIKITRTANTMFIWGIEVLTNSSAPAGGADPVCPETLTISSKDSKTAFFEGDAIELTAALSEGNGAITYQWYKGGTAEGNKLAGKTVAKLEIASCVEGDAGDYYCVASKSDCSDAVNADAFTITVAHNPCATYFWFFNDADQTANGKTNATSVFSNMVGGKSNMNGSITIDEVTYNVTRRSDDADPLGRFTVPANKAATFYTLAVSSGGDARKIVLTNTTTSATYEADVAGGKDSYKRVQIDNIAPGTYTIGKSGGNTRLGMVALKVCDATFRTITLEYADGTTPDGSLSVLDGTAATRPADPTWEHHRFDGWYNGETLYDWSANVTDDLTLTAHWTQLYTITYAAGDGTATGDAPTQVDKAEGETFTVAANTFEVAGKDFVKWNDGTKDYAPGATYTVGTDNVVLTAQWKAAADKYTVKFMDGTTELGTKLFDVTTNPSDADIDKTKALNTFAAWQKEGVDIALDDAFWATVAKDAEITLTARWEPKYATSRDFAAITTAGTTGDNPIAEFLANGNMVASNLGGSEWETSTSKSGYVGYKLKNTGATITFLVQGGKRVMITFGSIGANVTLKKGEESVTIPAASGDNAETVYPAFDVATDMLITLTTTSGSTVTLKSITIGEIPNISDDATLKDLKVNGETIDGFSRTTDSYYVEMPYGTQKADLPLVTATANHGKAAVIVQDAKDRPDDTRATIKVTAEDGTTIKHYYVYFTNAAKEGVNLVKATIGDNSIALVANESYIKSAIVQNEKVDGRDGGVSAGSKFQKNSYIKIEMPAGQQFRANDIVDLEVTGVGGTYKLLVYSENSTAAEKLVVNEATAPTLVVGHNKVQLNKDAQALYLVRDGSNNWNPHVKSIIVQRYMAPFIESFVIGEAEGTIDQANKTIAIEVPARTDVTALTPTIVAWANGGAKVTPTGAKDFTSPVTYKVSSAYAEDGTTEYTVTVTQAAAIKEVVISGTLSVLEDETTTLSATVIDTNDAEASNQNVTWTSNDETTAIVDANGVVTGVKAGTVTITATSVEDNTKSASVTITVAVNPCRTWKNPADYTTTCVVGKLQLKPVGLETLQENMTPYQGATKTNAWKLDAKNTKYAEISFIDKAQFDGFTVGVSSNGENKNYKFAVVCSQGIGEDFDKGIIEGKTYDAVDNNEPENLINVELPVGTRAVRVYRQYEQGEVKLGGGSSVFLYYVNACKKDFVSVTTVSVNNAKLGKGKSLNLKAIITPANADIESLAWSIESMTATNVTILGNVLTVAENATEGDVVVKVVATDVLGNVVEATATISIVDKFEVVKPVTATQVWNWAPVAVGEGETIADPDTVLANYISGDEWEMLAGNVGGRPYRSTSYKAYQGTSLYFKAAVPGLLIMYAGRMSDDKDVFVNGTKVGTVKSDKAYMDTIAVQAGGVYITSESMRIYWMKFDTDFASYEITDNHFNGYTREVTEGRYGTICLPNGGVMVGASIFEIAYKDASKIYFDEILNGKMEAGVPYIFLPNEGADKLAVFYTDEANASAGSKNGLVGSYTQELLETNGNNYILLNNQYCKVIGEAYVGANRAYFQLSGIPTSAPALAPGVRRVSMGMAGQNTATGVDQVQGDEAPTKMIINGQLFILRGEKMYDAQGKLVK